MERSLDGVREFLEALPDPAFMIDRSAVIRAANGPAHRLFGYPPGHLASQNLQLILPDLACRHADQPGQLQSARDKSGRTFQVEVHARPLELAGDSLTLCMIRDGITSGRGNGNGRASGTMERHRRTLDQMMEGCQIIGSDWRYLYVNDAVCRQGRKRREELLGHTMMEAYPGIESTPLFTALRRCMQQQTLVAFENEFRYPDGSAGWFELSIQPVPEGILILSIDATARKRAEQERSRQLNQLKALRSIDLAIIGHTGMTIALQTVLHHVAVELEVDAAAILLLNREVGLLEYGASCGFGTREIETTRLALGEGIAGRAAERRESMMVEDIARVELFVRRRLVADEGFVSYQAVPLVAKDEVQGVLELFHRTTLTPEPKWLEFRDALAGQAAIAIHSSRMYHLLELANLELLGAYDTTIEGWSRALDLRDRETLGHSVRVTDLTVRMARARGMSDGEVAHVRRGALLHDIGKMGIPDAILHKPGPLTESEWAIMRQHPVFALELLQPIEYLRTALDIPHCHHEKWDGSGYPRGLRGGAIPLAARLFAVVDVWDAIRSDRPYRAGWPEERAVDYLLSHAGTHFDPGAVDLFFQVLRDPCEPGRQQSGG